MLRIPDLDRLEEFHESHPSPHNVGIYELQTALFTLLDGDLDFLPQDVEHIESFWLLIEWGHSSAGFIMRLMDGRRVHLMCNIAQKEDETGIESVDLEVEEVPPHLSHPVLDADLGTGWRDDVEDLNEFVALWR